MIYILAVSDSDKHFKSAIDEYTKRLWKTIKLVQVKPIKNGNQKQIIDEETKKINSLLCKKTNSINILLSKDWEHLPTHQIKNILDKWANSSKDIIFIIWGPYWVDENKIMHINQKIAFGKITVPHWLAKLIILEQIYRSNMISSNRKYHY